MEALRTLTIMSERCYVIIDALDEYQGLPGFLKLIGRIQSSPSYRNVKLLITGRDKRPIARALGPISTRLSIPNPLLDQDITDFIRSKLSSEPSNLWTEDLRREVEDAIVKGADGLWVYSMPKLCMFDH